jgi:hypothetical protein
MSYIGNAPTTAAFLVDTFSGTGSQTAFTMTVAPANTSSIIVAITGVLQDPSTYSVSGTTLTFSAAPPSGTSNISVRYLGIPASGVTTTAYRTVTNTTATAGQTSFTIPSYTVGYVDVYRNGVYLPTSDYTATTGTTVVLANAATVGDTITTISFYVSSVLNALPTTGGTISGTLIVTGTETVPTITSPTATALTLQSAGTTAVTIDTSQRVTIPNQTGFKATGFNGSSAQTVASTGDGTANISQYLLNTSSTYLNFNIGSAYNTSTGRFTAPIAGRYLVFANIRWETNAFVQNAYIRVYASVNNSDTTTGYNTGLCAINGNNEAWSNYMTTSISGILNLNANDYVDLKGGMAGGTSVMWPTESGWGIQLLA